MKLINLQKVYKKRNIQDLQKICQELGCDKKCRGDNECSILSKLTGVKPIIVAECDEDCW